MSADFTAVVTNGLVSIKQSGEAAASALRKVSSSIKSAGADAVSSFGSMRRMASDDLKTTGEEASKATNKMKELGAAVARMGGPAGSIGGRLFGSAGASGGMAAIGLAAVGIGIAFKGVTTAMQFAEERAKAFSDAMAGIRDSYKQAADAQRDFASGSESAAITAEKAYNVYGQSAGDVINEATLGRRVTKEDAANALVKTAKVRKDLRKPVLDAAIAVADTMEASAETAAETIMASPMIIGLVKAGKNREAAAAALVEIRGSAPTKAAREEALKTINGDRFSQEYKQGVAVASERNKVFSAQVESYRAGEFASTVRQNTKDQLDPLGKATRDLSDASARARSALQDQADATGAWVTAMQTIGRVFGGQGSAEQQIDRLNEAGSNAEGSRKQIFGTGGN